MHFIFRNSFAFRIKFPSRLVGIVIMSSEWFEFQWGPGHETRTKRKLQYGRLRHGGTHRRIANLVGRERLNHRRKPQFVYYANAIQRSNEVGGLLCGSWVYRTCAGKGLINESCTARGHDAWPVDVCRGRSFNSRSSNISRRIIPFLYGSACNSIISPPAQFPRKSDRYFESRES